MVVASLPQTGSYGVSRRTCTPFPQRPGRQPATFTSVPTTLGPIRDVRTVTIGLET